MDYFELNKPTQDDADPTTLKSGNGFNQDLASKSCSSSTVPKKGSKKNAKKRQHED